MRKIAASKFKATCLALIDRVAENGEPIEITKRGKPLARLVAVRSGRAPGRSIFGVSKRHVLYLAPDEELLSTGEVWDAER